MAQPHCRLRAYWNDEEKQLYIFELQITIAGSQFRRCASAARPNTRD
jgi:hypothetical protein